MLLSGRIPTVVAAASNWNMKYSGQITKLFNWKAQPSGQVATLPNWMSKTPDLQHCP